MKHETTTRFDDELTAFLVRAPILSRLKLIDLARLLPHARERTFAESDILINEGGSATDLVLLIDGQVKVSQGQRSMGVVQEGYLGEESVLDGPVYYYQATAMTSVRALVFNGKQMSQALNGAANLKRDFHMSLLRYNLKDTLCGHKSNCTDDRHLTIEPTSSDGNGETKTFIGWLLAFLVPIGLYFFLDTIFKKNQSYDALGFSVENLHNIRIFVAVFATTILLWVFKLVPDFIAGLLTILVVLILGITPSSAILSGFQSSSFFMAMSIFVLSAVVVSSGLVYRLSLLILRYTRPSKFFYNLMLTLFGLSITMVLPSANGRIALVTPLLTDLIDSLGLQRQGTEANRLAVTAFFGISLFSSIFMTSKSINFLIFGMLSCQTQDSFQWLNWTMAASVAGGVGLFLLLLLTAVSFRSREKIIDSRVHVDRQLRILGRMSAREWGAIFSIFLLITGIVTTSIHKIEPAWIGLSLMFTFLALGTMSKGEFRSKIDWPFLFLLGTLIGLAKSILYLKIDIIIAQHLVWATSLMQEHLMLFILALALITMLVRLALSINATIVILASIFLPLAEQAGINMWVMGFMILTLSEGFFLPYQCSYYLMFQGYNEQMKIYSEKSFLRFNLWGMVIRLLLIYVSIPFWKAMEILQ